MNRSSEYRALMAVAIGGCALAALSSVAPVVEHIVGGALLGGGALWAVVAVLRRERRIRARLADPGHPHDPATPGPGTTGPVLWAGPGDQTPAPPTPTELIPFTPGARRPAAPTGGAR